MSRWLPPPPPDLPADAHKGLAGRALLACGSRWMPGAAILAARSALRAGAGLVSVLCQDDALPATLAPAVPEATYLPAGRGAVRWEDQHAALAGPGLGTHDGARALLEEVLAGCAGPLVLDADALNLLAGRLERLRGRPGPVVLTPHPGEAARLLGRPVPSDDAGRLEAAREIAARAGAICCLKGRGTVVTDGERTFVNDTGTPAMATAGSGDVLAGILTAYLARTRSLPATGWGPFEAAARAVRVHGLAGEIAEAALGSLAVCASDLVLHLPAAQRALG
jgi:NAD(P)H-hydrate epimerase